MSYNGAGTFLINSAGQPVVAGTTISETVFNALTADLATGLSTAITKDGQTTATANLPMGGFKLTNLAAGTASTDSAQLGQVQSGAATLITITGTNTVVGTLTPTLTAYAAGQQFSFVAAATNTTSVTLNIDGLGAKAITRSGATALIAGDITVGTMITVIYDGVKFQMSDANSVTATGSTTSRTLANRFADVVNVKDFGAVGDGVTDDTAAVQLAVVSSPNKRIYFPKGTYLVSAGTLLAASQTVFGDGQDNTVFRTNTSGFDVFDLTSNGASVTNVGFFSPTHRTSGAYVRLSASTRSNRVADVKMKNGFKGIYISSGSVITILENLEILDCTPSTGMGIHIQGGNDTFLSKVVMDNNPAAYPAYGVYIQSSYAVWMTDCDMIHSGIGLMLSPQSPGETITWCFFEQVACDTSTYGIVIAPAAGRVVNGITFMNCWGATHTFNGVRIDGAGTTDGVQFIGGRFVNNGQSGAVIATALPVNVDFINCIASGNSGSSPGLYSGFDIGVNVNKFRIMGCISGPALGFGDSQNRGILVNAGTSTNYVIKDNNLLGNTTGMIDNGTGASVVAGNSGYVTQASGTSSVPIGQTVANVTHGMAVTPNVQDIIATMTSSPVGSGVTGIWIATVTSSTFQIATNAVVAGADLSVAWQVRSKGS